MTLLLASLIVFSVVVVGLLAFGSAAAWTRRDRDRFEADLRADHEAIWRGWYETWCPGCRVFSIERSIICRFCDRELTILKDFGAIARGEDQRDPVVMVDQARRLQQAKLRDQHVAQRRRTS